MPAGLSLDPLPGFPARLPDITGFVTAVTEPAAPGGSRRIRVVQDSTRSAGTPAADVRVPAHVRVVRRETATTRGAAIERCQVVSVWFDGPVAESFPVQATAGGVVIERMPQVSPAR
jgi:hypothetical protein